MQSPLDGLLGLLELRKDIYQGAVGRFAISGGANDPAGVCYARIDFLSRHDPKPSETILDYGNFSMTQTYLSLPDGIRLARDLEEKKILHVRDAEVKAQGAFSHPYVRYVASQQTFSSIRSDWPWIWYQFGGIQGGKSPQEPLAKIGLPLYPDGWHAIAKFCDLNLDMGATLGQIMFILPDFRARIKNMKILENEILVDVEARETSVETLRVKFYIGDDHRSESSSDFLLKNNSVGYPYEGNLKLVLVHLLSEQSNQDIDSRRFNPLWENLQGTQVIDPQLRVKELVRDGEGVNIEFKKEIREDNTKRRFVHSIVAFANTSGGTVIIGVTDDAEVEGVPSPDKVIQTVDNLVADKCDPPPQVYCSIVEFQEKHVVLVDVPRGSVTPYQVRDGGCFVRRGRTNRHATTIELTGLTRVARVGVPS